MNLRTKIGKHLAVIVILGGAGASLGFGIPWMQSWLKQQEPSLHSSIGADGPRLIDTDTFSVPDKSAQSMGIRAVLARRPTRYRGLAPMPGSLALDLNRMARIHPRFAGEVVEIGSHYDWNALTPSLIGTAGNCWAAALSSAVAAPGRPLALGDTVYLGQLLAVVWNKDLVEKKWELVDALSQKRLEERTNARLEALVREGAVPLARLEESRRTLAQSRAAVARAELTLRAWRLTDDDMAEIYAEEKRIYEEGAERARKRPTSWARVEVRASLPGTILEKNVIVGDFVDTSTDLFKVADLSVLAVHANLYEEDLPHLLKLTGPIPWNIHLKSDPQAAPLVGSVRKIGSLIDPAQRTVLLTGEVKNPSGRLRPGQFITASVRMPPPEDEVEVPTMALLEDGDESVVLVQPNLDKNVFALRRVTVVRRFQDVVNLASSAELEPEHAPPGTVCRGEWVVSAGALELRNVLAELQRASPGGVDKKMAK